jgi:hypothetical protein
MLPRQLQEPFGVVSEAIEHGVTVPAAYASSETPRELILSSRYLASPSKEEPSSKAMPTTTRLKLVSCLLLTPLCSMLAGCAASANADRSFPAMNAATPLEAVLAAVPSQGPGIAEIHPRTMLALAVTIGETDFETNDGTAIFSASEDAYEFRLRGEHFWESELGVFFSGHYGSADEIGGPGTSLDEGGAFLALSYRATMGDTFRMPVRFGPFFQTSDQDGALVGGPTPETITRELVGVRLSAEPEYIIFQQDKGGGKLAELSAFVEISCGSGPTNISAGALDEDGYAFTLGWELGARYKFPFGLLAGLSFLSHKTHFAATESYNSGVFFGVDDDFTGVCVTVGARF